MPSNLYFIRKNNITHNLINTITINFNCQKLIHWFGHPTEKKIKLHDIVLVDRIQFTPSWPKLKSSHGSVVSVLNGHVLITDLLWEHIPSKEDLALLTHNLDELLHNIITVDEIYAFLTIQESKQLSNHLVSPAKSALKLTNMDLSTNKVMATIFLDSQSIVYVDYHQKENRQFPYNADQTSSTTI